MNGLWMADFTAGPAHGTGIVVFGPGELLGGDASHTYRGTWEEDGPALNARVRVEPWSAGGGPPPTERDRPFMLTLIGSRTEKAATLSGHPDENPILTISVGLKRAA
jgi:hypothetical protein